jgi:hypothetical protein
MVRRSIAVIGSFRRHNREVQQACAIFRAVGHTVTSPKSAEVIEEGIPFVRFNTDNRNWSDPAVQSLALHRIFRADVVYVVRPLGYIGRTTSYEIGRVIHHRKPIYFSQRPNDLPIRIPDQFIVDAGKLTSLFSDIGWQPSWLYDTDGDHAAVLERALADGCLSDE